MKQLFQEIKGALDKGEELVMVTVIASSGSTPRGAGSRMLVRTDGSTRGTIGGGAVEYRAVQAAGKVLEEKASCTRGFSLTRNQVADIGMVCGGDVVVYFQYLSPENQEFRTLSSRILELLGREEDSWLLLDITDETCWQMGVYTKSGGLYGMDSGDLAYSENPLFVNRAVLRETGGRKYYIEPLVQAGMVYVFGGGHVAQELVPVLTHIGFRCVVMDDRAEFANPTVFPDAVRTIVGDLEHISDYVEVKHQDYVCIMTRGHQFDYYVQRQMLEAKPYYIGIMGSRNKIKVVTEKLVGDGFDREEIQACHMPIGLNIDAETPAEIAVSIAGELIAVRAERMGKKKH